jgi:hypothetical protein
LYIGADEKEKFAALHKDCLPIPDLENQLKERDLAHAAPS